jgi:hypothetical protein
VGGVASDWTPRNPDDEGAKVTSYAIDDGERLLLLDPLALPREIEEVAADRETAIVLTCAWHERDTRSLAERLDAAVFVPSPEEGDPIEGRRLFSAGDRLPVGVSAFPGKDENDLVLWVESRRALAVGDTLIDRGRGLQIPVDWLSEGVTREQVVACFARCSSCRSSSCFRRTGSPLTEPPSSARSPDARIWPVGRIVAEVRLRAMKGIGPLVGQCSERSPERVTAMGRARVVPGSRKRPQENAPIETAKRNPIRTARRSSKK